MHEQAVICPVVTQLAPSSGSGITSSASFTSWNVIEYGLLMAGIVVIVLIGVSRVC